MKQKSMTLKQAQYISGFWGKIRPGVARLRALGYGTERYELNLGMMAEAEAMIDAAANRKQNRRSVSRAAGR